MGGNLVFLLVSMTLFAVQPFVGAAPEVYVDRWHIHVVNELSSGNLYAHCKSRDTDVGEQNITPGGQIQWSFKENIFGSTLFWCLLKKPSGESVSFDVFWHETDTYWLHYRCTLKGTCFWIAKDDGIYLKNLPENFEDLVHKWSS